MQVYQGLLSQSVNIEISDIQCILVAFTFYIAFISSSNYFFTFLLHFPSSLSFFAFLLYFPSLLSFFTFHSLLAFFLEVKRNGVEAVTFPCWGRPVFKDMPQMASATGTDYLDPVHEIAVVFLKPDPVTGNCIIETWPACS